MRTLRTVLAALVAALLVAGVLSTSAGAASKPERIIDEIPPSTKQVTYNAFKLKGTVLEPQVDGTTLPYANQQVKILKKKCGTCKWKTVKKVKTNADGVFKTRIYAPERGRWKWRSKVDHSNGYANTKGEVWTLFFR
ncbi:hypothetical protein GCM10011376_11250 [Nocardioides flavus (ex Wang et al. 2016)]|uniref:DUF4198 domain-containing protein n=1 Tax=Nocardioides flavus (ex Wang et al. 2016) TaxID=2058780 RepID=A0ABQ3HL06_9ACTN|nr:hypothetical protein [Nocardioides flavus (ex Wang et al. 2016)]GHE16515.1 hypothetical protein GCM10011376_11250 [Nocardioides flavus (ex Wang et al. 2016)]